MGYLISETFKQTQNEMIGIWQEDILKIKLLNAQENFRLFYR